jgi:Fur family ferric uptake transcriptional regulator
MKKRLHTMNTKSKYNTKQKAELTAYLMSKAGEHVTVNDVCRHFEEKGRPIGVTTVYRQLDKMVEEGLVNKYNLDSKSSACYEYIDSEHHMDGACSCYHCKCEKCGKLIHLHCKEIEELMKHIEGNHGFVINPKSTVFYGVCEDCK